MIGQQGCVTLQYDCTGCAERRVTFESSIKHETENCTAVGLALQVVQAQCILNMLKFSWHVENLFIIGH